MKKNLQKKVMTRIFLIINLNLFQTSFFFFSFQKFNLKDLKKHSKFKKSNTTYAISDWKNATSESQTKKTTLRHERASYEKGNIMRQKRKKISKQRKSMLWQKQSTLQKKK